MGDQRQNQSMGGRRYGRGGTGYQGNNYIAGYQSSSNQNPQQRPPFQGTSNLNNQQFYRNNQSSNYHPNQNQNYRPVQNQYYNNQQQGYRNQFNQQPSGSGNLITTPQGNQNSRNIRQGGSGSSGVVEKPAEPAPNGGRDARAEGETRNKKSSDGKDAVAAKLQCFRCYVHGDHITKDCKAEIECDNCDKTNHMSSRCTWLKQRKHVATMVGFGAEGLGCFVAEHAKEKTGTEKEAAVALIKIREGLGSHVSSEMLEISLAKTYPWRWTWKAKEVAADTFLVNFPNVAKINEAAIYDWVPLKGAQIMVNIKLWSDETIASGKMSVVWFSVRGVPKQLKNFHGLHEVGSTIGQCLEADMGLLKKTGKVRLKCGVVDHLKIPKWTRVVTPKLLFYQVFIKLEEIVELGWQRPEEEILQDFEEIPEKNAEEEDRNAKRQKGNENSDRTPSGTKTTECDVIQASTRTMLALAEREQYLKEQDAFDAELCANKKENKNLSEKPNEKDPEEGDDWDGNENSLDDVGGEGDDIDGEERVDITGNEEDDAANLSQNSFAEKMSALFSHNAVPGAGKEETGEDKGPRCSDRLATKNTSDLPVMEAAKNLTRAKNLDKGEDERGRKSGAATVRKNAGASRG